VAACRAQVEVEVEVEVEKVEAVEEGEERR